MGSTSACACAGIPGDERRGQGVPVRKLFRATRVNQPMAIDGRAGCGAEWFFSGCHLGSGEYLILFSPTPAEDSGGGIRPPLGDRDALRRVKNQGFGLEQTHLAETERPSRCWPYWR